MTDQSTVDFSKMPQNELATALGRINKDRYPANYAACEREILARKSSGVWVERAGLPEVTRLRPEFSLRRRFFSFSLDGVAISAIAVLFFPLSGLINQMGAAAILPFWALCVAYFAVLEGPAGQGQTLGKKLMGLRVVREDGETLSLRQSSLRSLFALALFGFRYGLVSYLPSSPVFQVLGGIVAVFNVA